jgi:hypothetical protein
MITTLSAMRNPLTKALIIVLALLLSACSAVRLAYDQGPTLGWWWIDGYFDFPSDSAPRVKQSLDQWFAWHRATQLGDYAGLLVAAQAQVMEPATPAQVCRWVDEFRARAQPALERAIPLAADIVPTLTPAQLQHAERKYAKVNDEMRDEYLQTRPDERLEASVKRAVERAEMLYGRLDEPQRKLIAAGVAASPFDADAWLAERKTRQRETLQTLRRLVAERADHDSIVAALRVLAQQADRSQRPDYRAYQQRLNDHNCQWVAAVHNATTPAQRRVARDRLKGWEADLRSLVAS